MLIATNVDPITIYDWVTKGGLVGLLVFLLYGGYKRWWVFGWNYKELERRNAYLEHSNARWMELAFKSTKITEEVTTMIRESNEII